jgi:hypothetical protein
MDPPHKAAQVAGCALALWLLLALFALFIGQTGNAIGTAGYWPAFESLMEYVGLYIVTPVWFVSRFLIAGFRC